METIIKLYNWMDMDIASIDYDLECYHLTMNEGRDGQDYWWYLDEDGYCGAINIATGEIITDEARIEELFC